MSLFHNRELNESSLSPFRSLHDIPQAVRFPIAGAVNTTIFMTSLYLATAAFKESYPVSTIYSVVSMLCLPIGHAVSSLVVFGWPKPYLPNLLMNLPIGISATAVGTFCTGLLNNIEFDLKCIQILQYVSLMVLEEEQESGNMFSSVLVMIITGLWGYVLSVYVNGAPSKKHDKEL